MTKPIRIMMISIVIIFLGVIVFNFGKKILIKQFFAHYHVPAIAVAAETAQTKDWHSQLHAVGDFVAINGVDLNTQASGNVIGIHFTSGQYIDANQPLLDIDDNIEQATLKYNQANLALQEANYKRYINLSQHHYASTASVDDARARVIQAQANLEKTQTLIAHKHPRAPFAGQLGIRQVSLGQYVREGITPIVSLQSLDPIYINFSIPEQWADQLSLGQSVFFGVDQNPGLLFNAKLSAINSKVDPNTHTLQVQATLANCPALTATELLHSPLVTVKRNFDGRTVITCDTERNHQQHLHNFNFMPGMFASIQLAKAAHAPAVVIPSTAIAYSLYGDSVFVIEKHTPSKESRPKLTVRRVYVETGEQQGNYTVISKGLQAGQLIVAAGGMKLQNGTPVTINNSVALNTEPFVNRGP